MSNKKSKNGVTHVHGVITFLKSGTSISRDDEVVHW